MYVRNNLFEDSQPHVDSQELKHQDVLIILAGVVQLESQNFRTGRRQNALGALSVVSA